MSSECPFVRGMRQEIRRLFSVLADERDMEVDPTTVERVIEESLFRLGEDVAQHFCSDVYSVVTDDEPLG